MYNEGISKVGDLLDLAAEMEIVSKRGSFFNYGDLRLGQGRENAKDFLREHPDLADEIEMAVRERAMSGDVPLSLGSSGSSGSDDGEAVSRGVLIAFCLVLAFDRLLRQPNYPLCASDSSAVCKQPAAVSRASARSSDPRADTTACAERYARLHE